MTVAARPVVKDARRRAAGRRSTAPVRGPLRTARERALASAVLRAIAYADVFDWALTTAEIHRFLPIPATPAEVAATVERLSGPSGALSVEHGFTFLSGRSGLPATRRTREAASRILWARARRWVRVVGALPFVRMVAVTGSLAVEAADTAADVDLLVVTADGRVWVTRALAMLVVRVAAVAGVRLCPNYLVARSDLVLSDRTLFTAHELVQMVPVSGQPVYEELLSHNRWYLQYLPHATPGPGAAPARPASPWSAAAEAILGLALFDRLERWEMRRKVAKLRAESQSSEIRYDATCCKGHADEHGRRVLAALDARLRAVAEEA